MALTNQFLLISLASVGVDISHFLPLFNGFDLINRYVLSTELVGEWGRF